ncbi:glycosyltransferase family 4 protein [Streptomyces sp. AS02]|uniref:glycosyltransferase family 4 protein n=1 Tax=Streptomyces sp. AS02 TaxID=2938946 RepID=UPI0020206BAE|nr:glycosyltransferase family 4 protein [Streptomyces sp. AS02]MCL8012093.1 glycosyltransferase family 4 protein [Streptomyces sp. AS02]
MRILQIISVGSEVGGAEKSVRLIKDGLERRGHRVHVIATDRMSAGRQTFADELVPAISGNAAQRIARHFWYQRAYRQVGQALQTFQPDCVHLHTIGEFGPAVLAATAGYPQVLTVHGPEEWTRSLLRWKLDSAAAAHRLSTTDVARYAYYRFMQRPAYLPWLRRVTRILTPSRYFADAIRRDVGSVPLFVVPNGIEHKSAQPLSETEHVVFAGRLERVKGVGVLLDALRELLPVRPGVRLTVVGDGPDRTRLEASAADLVAAQRVIFRGWLAESDVIECLGTASVVALPSIWPENFPTVALEALQVGRPLVASRVGGLPELVGGDNGALVAAGSAGELAAALDGLLGRRVVLERMGAASASRAERYRLEEFLDALEHHYKQAAAT